MRGVRSVLALAAIGLLLASTAHAQSSLGIGAAEPSIPSTGLFGPLFSMVNQYQQSFYRALTGSLKAMRRDPAELWTLIGLSFAYGIFHAAGPGHGKAVISSYMLANETELRRGIFISFISAMLQGLMAIIVVGLAFLVLRGTSISMTEATTALERASFGLIAAFGGWLLLRKLRGLWGSRPSPSLATETSQLFSSSPAEPHVHGPDCRHGFPGETRPASTGFVCESCGHAHLPDPGMLDGRFGVREAWSATIAVGLRPCSGALLVLTFSLLNGLYLGGLLSVLAMSVGTAITVSALAILAVSAKGAALRVAGIESRAGRLIGNGVEIAGALVVMLMGLLLLGASFQGSGPY